MRWKIRALRTVQAQALAWLGLIAMPIALSAIVLAFAANLPSAQAQPKPTAGATVWLPFVSGSVCACDGNLLANGDFERDGRGWYTRTYPSWWKRALIGSEAQGFHPHRGEWAARLGGVEGAMDAITQTVTLPVKGQLSYWWWMHSYDNLPLDSLGVELYALDGSLVARLPGHGIEEPQDVWQRDTIDVSAYAGQTLILSFDAYNDNYYFSWWDLDDVCLRGTP